MQGSRKKSIRKRGDTSLIRSDLTQRTTIPKGGLHVTSLRHSKFYSNKLPNLVVMRLSRPSLLERKRWETNPNQAYLEFEY